VNPIPSTQTLRIGVLILAAGAGRRMGGRAKCLLKLDGRSLLERLVFSVRSLGLDNPVLVLGHHAADIQAHLAQWPLQFMPLQAINPAPGDDPSTSLHVGLRALDGDVQAIMVLLGDQPLIDAPAIDAVLTAFQRRPSGCHVLVPVVRGEPGHPVMFDARVCADLLAVPGSSLRQWRAAHPQATCLWAVDDPAYTCDLDTPGDVEFVARDSGWTID
jgi:molybdenum cofactor cytidylyltransferase